MSDNKEVNVSKIVINDRSVVYNNWEDFWKDTCKNDFGINVPIRFFWSGDEELNIQLMSIHIAKFDTRSIIECIINNVSREDFINYTSTYKLFFNQYYDTHIVKTIEDYQD